VPKAHVETTIEKSADEVWARIGNFGDLSWFPGVESVSVDGDERATKVEGMNLYHVERLVRRDDAARTYTYATVGFRGDTLVRTEDGGMFDLNTMSGHEGTITVLPAGDASARVTYGFAVDDPKMAETMREQYQSVLADLKKQLEG
jgi:carbon monoxide dehydrogenase subunit G